MKSRKPPSEPEANTKKSRSPGDAAERAAKVQKDREEAMKRWRDRPD